MQHYRYESEGLVLHGIVPRLSDIYAQIDIAINPVYWGAGLKIKTVEAMANGLPLVTTAEGARGLRPLAGKAFLVAADRESFVAGLNELIADFNLRQNLAREGADFVAKFLKPESCFRDLLAAIHNPA